MTGPAAETGWERLAQVVAADIPVAEVDRVWCFPVLRQGQREFGTAVIARREGDDGDRVRIYTARYLLQIKGKERGKFEADLKQVGSGPVERLPDLIEEAHRRSDDEDPPVEADVAEWFAMVHDPAVG
ncbi:MAG TPA: hypothetical protein VFI41_03150 [Gemmatimonadales bacterium]|nr:hypothetical protein [Gemmatimonadales bacterium]